MAITIDGSSGIASVDGSAGSPSIRGSDANSGILYTADAIKFSTGGVQRAVVDNNGLSSAGHILQVVQTVKTDTSSVSVLYDSPADLGISCAITPIATSSKILVDCNLLIGSHDFFAVYIWLIRGSTQILLTDAAGSRTRSSKVIQLYHNSGWESAQNTDVNIKYLDSPNTTSATTYKIQAAAYSANRAVYLNRAYNDRDSADYYGRSTSTITLMEVAT